MYLQLTDNHYTVDIEANSLTPDRIWCLVVHRIATDELWHFRPADVPKFKSFVLERPDAVWVGHNIVSFDAPAIKRLLGVTLANVVDTLILSYLYHPHMPGGHSLAAWGERFKFPKGSFTDFDKYSEEMLAYCEQDVRLTSKLFTALTKRMSARGYTELSCRIEHGARRVIDQQKANGFYFDADAARALYEDLREAEAAVVAKIAHLFPPELVPVHTYQYRIKADGQPYASYIKHRDRYPKLLFADDGSEYTVYDWQDFNLGSPKQRSDRLLGLGWVPTRFTPKGSPKVDEDALVEFAESSGIEEVAALADWLVYNGRANMLNTWLNYYDPASGCIHGDVFSCGAGTRRMRHNNPNTANIPGSGAKYGAECRAVWRARPGRNLIGVDAKGIEGRIFAHYLNNPEGIRFFLEGDPHQANADAVTKAVGFDVSRNQAKGLLYARLYGASNTKLGLMLGEGPKVGKLVRAAIDSNIPGFKKLVAEVEAEFKRNGGWLECLDGGYVRCPSAHAALNYKFQSAGAIVMKLAAIILETEKNVYDALKVGDIHDEWQYDVLPEHAEDFAKAACTAITEAGELLGCRVKLEGDYKIGKNWAETH